MAGRQGLLFAIFALLVWIARWLDIGGLREMSAVSVQAVGLVFCFGLASCIVGGLSRYWAAVRASD